MKKVFTLCCLLAATITYAQNSNVGIGTTTPDPAAALDITATGKGLLIPRMDSVSRVAITNPPDGLMVFQNDGRKGFWYAISGNWLYIPDKTASGDNLGNHTATQNINLQSQLLVGAKAINGAPGTTGIRVDSLGQVGINANDPSQLLQLGTVDYPKPAMIRYAAGSGFGSQRQWETGINVNVNNPNDASGENYDFAVRDVTANATRMLIEYGTGRTGIGTSSPLMQLHVSKGDSAVALLENQQTLAANVKTALYFKTGNVSYPYTGSIQTIGGNSSTARLGFFTYASSVASGLLERLSITDGGNVGIATITPSQKLEVAGTAKATSLISTGNVSFGESTTADGTLSTGMRLGGPSAGEGIAWKSTAGGNQYGLDLFTGGQSRLSVNNNGRIGIGTAAPFSQLSNTTDNIVGSDNNGGNPGSLSWAATQDGYVGQIYNGGTGGAANGMAIKVASTTSTALDVSQGTTQNAAGTSLFKVTSGGDVSYAGTLNMGIQYIYSQSNIAGNNYGSRFLTCPAGTRLIGGGGGHRDYNSAQSDLQLNYSGPDLSGTANTWRILITNNSSSSRAVIIYAICAKVQ